MDRLTERFKNGQAAVYGCGSNCKYDYKYCESHLEDCPTISEIYEKLAEYEDLEEQGKLLKLPCAVGDTYFCIDDGSYPNEWEFVNVQQIISVMDKIGKTVFLTRPEAERALAEMEGKK